MKVLIISHNPMSTKHSIGKTLLSLFSIFNKEELCQLYIHTGLPEKAVCNSFYRITDIDVLKGFFTRKVNGGRVDALEQNQPDENKDSQIYQMTYGSSKKRQPYREVLRDIMWKFSPWYNSGLKAWLEKEKPTCIFVAIGSSTFLYNMAVKISAAYNIPIFTYVCDDFYSMNVPKAFLGRYWKRAITKKTDRLMAHSSGIITICDELTNYYAAQFNKPAYTVMTGTNYQVAKNPKDGACVNTLCYFGKLSLNRYLSMADICRVIDEINKEKNQNFKVEIFSDLCDEQAVKAFDGIDCVKLNGFITGDDFKSAFFSSDVLIHIEAFDEESVDRVKFSVSTKIADSLSSGIPMFAYGPENVASMQHLIRNRCAVTAVSKAELKIKLESLLFDENVRKAISCNALSTAERFHNPQNVSLALKKHITECQTEKI